MGNSNTKNKKKVKTEVKRDPLEGYEFTIAKDDIETDYRIYANNDKYFLAYVKYIVIEGRRYDLVSLNLSNMDGYNKRLAFAIKTFFTRTEKGYKFNSYELVRNIQSTYSWLPFYSKGERYCINTIIENNNKTIRNRYDLAEEIYPKVVKTYKDHEFKSDELKLDINTEL